MNFFIFYCNQTQLQSSPTDQSSLYAADPMKCLTLIATDCNNTSLLHTAFADFPGSRMLGPT
jgi:hypothetical protein